MAVPTASSIEYPDLIVIGVYFLIVLIVGVWSSRRVSKGSISSYFLASRNMHFIPVGASLFASNIGSEHFIGLAGSGAASGIGVACFELHAMFTMVILGWFFVPVYRASGVFTMPEYLRKRFGGQRIRIYISCLALMLYVFVKVSADLYAGSIFLDQAFGLKQWYISVLVLLLISGLFTVAGGLSAVIWTDLVQAIIMIIGALVVMAKSFIAVGGYDRLVEEYYRAVSPDALWDEAKNKSCGQPPDYAMHLLRDPRPGMSDIPWTGIVFGLPVSAIWYWCSDQVIVQRVLASKNMIQAKGGCLLAGYLKFLPLFLLVFPGMAARVLFTETVACADPVSCEAFCGNKKGCWNIAYPHLVISLLPAGMRGLMLAVMMAAIMSSLTSIFNSASTVFTIDIWRRFRRNCSENEQLVVGRLFVVVLVTLSVMWIPVIQNSKGSQLFHYMQSVTSFLAPPICAVYIMGMFVPRVNEKGAFTGLMVGLVVGMIRFALEFSYTVPPCGSGLPDPRPDFVRIFVGKVHFLHFGLALFLLVVAVSVGVSLMTQPIDKVHLYRLTFWTRHSTEVRVDLDHGERFSQVSETKVPPPTIPEPQEETGFGGTYPANDHSINTNDVESLCVCLLEGLKRIDAVKSMNPVTSPPNSEDRNLAALGWDQILDAITKPGDPEAPEVPAWRRMVDFVCCLQSGSNGESSAGDEYMMTSPSGRPYTEAEKAQMAADSIYETPMWRRFININALVGISCSIFVWSYFG